MINKSKSNITPSTPASHKKGVDVQLMTNKSKSTITATNKTKTSA